MLPLWITCAVVLPVVLLVFYVVARTRPGRFKLSASVLKLLSINIEVDAEDRPKELPAAPESGVRSAAPDHRPPG